MCICQIIHNCKYNPWNKQQQVAASWHTLRTSIHAKVACCGSAPLYLFTFSCWLPILQCKAAVALLYYKRWCTRRRHLYFSFRRFHSSSAHFILTSSIRGRLGKALYIPLPRAKVNFTTSTELSSVTTSYHVRVYGTLCIHRGIVHKTGWN